MKIQLSEERSRILTEKVQAYIKDEFGESIGELKAELLIEFFIKEIGPPIYNQAINDAHSFIQDKLIDLEGDLYFPEES